MIHQCHGIVHKITPLLKTFSHPDKNEPSLDGIMAWFKKYSIWIYWFQVYEHGTTNPLYFGTLAVISTVSPQIFKYNVECKVNQGEENKKHFIFLYKI